MKKIRYLLDEHVDPALGAGLKLRCPDITVWKIGDPGVLPLGTADSEILIWCERQQFILITNNRSSMPVHLTDHLLSGRHIPGIFILNPNRSMGEHIDDFEYVWKAADSDEFKDIIWYLPIRR